jgi:hypothetical protein
MVAAATVLEKVHDFPAILIKKLAVPEVAGVPEIEIVTSPLPLLKTPEETEAVKPVTPVELEDEAE